LGRLKVQASAQADMLNGATNESDIRVGLLDGFLTLSAGPVAFNIHLGVDTYLTSAEADLDFQFRLTVLGVGGVAIKEFAYEIYSEALHTIIDETVLIPDLAAGTPIAIEVEMHAFAICSVTLVPTCSAFVDAGNTAYIGVDGDVISTSGYSYPGFLATAAVPLPASMSLFLFGVAGLGALRTRAT